MSTNAKKIDADLNERADSLYYSSTSRRQLVETVSRELQSVRDAAREKALYEAMMAVIEKWEPGAKQTLGEITSAISALRAKTATDKIHEGGAA